MASAGVKFAYDHAPTATATATDSGSGSGSGTGGGSGTGSDEPVVDTAGMSLDDLMAQFKGLKK
jgi:hypothetical protein